MRNNRHELLPIVVQENHALIEAKLLHKTLNVKTRLGDWIQRRIDEYGFEKDKDYYSNLSSKKGRGGHNALNYLLTLDMAKELAMVERNETGRAIRRYFIEKERELRGLLVLPSASGLFNGIKPYRVNNVRLYPYKAILQRCGYSIKTGGSRRARYPQHFLLVGSLLYITEAFSLHLHHQKQVMQNRVKLMQTQPVLPLDFGTSYLPTKTLNHG